MKYSDSIDGLFVAAIREPVLLGRQFASILGEARLKQISCQMFIVIVPIEATCEATAMLDSGNDGLIFN